MEHPCYYPTFVALLILCGTFSVGNFGKVAAGNGDLMKSEPVMTTTQQPVPGCIINAKTLCSVENGTYREDGCHFYCDRQNSWPRVSLFEGSVKDGTPCRILIITGVCRSGWCRPRISEEKKDKKTAKN